MHRSRLSVLCLDIPVSQRDDAETFWASALQREWQHGTNHPEYTDFGELNGYGVLLQATNDGPARVHLDIHTDDHVAEVTRLQTLGARIVEEGREWTVMIDPAGLIFCVVPVASDDQSLRGAAEWP